MQPSSGHLSRPDENVASIGSLGLCPPEAPWRRRCAPIACRALHPSERVQFTVSEAIGKWT